MTLDRPVHAPETADGDDGPAVAAPVAARVCRARRPSTDVHPPPPPPRILALSGRSAAMLATLT